LKITTLKILPAIIIQYHINARSYPQQKALSLFEKKWQKKVSSAKRPKKQRKRRITKPSIRETDATPVYAETI